MPPLTRRFLFVLVNGGGNVPSQMSIARRLAHRGHDVHVLGDDPIRRYALAAGCRFHPFMRAPQGMPEVVDERTREWERGSSFAKLRKLGNNLMFGPAALHAADLLDAAERVVPDAIAIDCLLVGAMIGAEKSRIPSAVLVHFPLHGHVPGVVPMGFGAGPAHGAVGRLRNAILDEISRLGFRFGLAPVNAARKALGLTPLRNVLDQLHRLDRSLLLLPREFDFVPAGLPSNATYVGAQLDDPPHVGTSMTDYLRSDGKPLVVLTLGSTYQAQEATFTHALQALAMLPVHGIASYGMIEPPPMDHRPDNVTIAQWVSHADILPKASAVICHGGLGTVLKSLAHGVPVIVLPLGRDQKDNAARVVACGAGMWRNAHASPRRIAGAVSHLLADKRYAQGAQRMAGIIARDVKEDRAVQEMELLAQSRGA